MFPQACKRNIRVNVVCHLILSKSVSLIASVRLPVSGIGLLNVHVGLVKVLYSPTDLLSVRFCIKKVSYLVL